MAIVRIRRGAGSVDEHGDPIPGPETRTTLVGAFTAPRAAGTTRPSHDINEPARDGVVVGLTLYGPTTLDVIHTDVVEVDDVRYEVDGEAGRWINPLTGWAAGIEVALRRAEG